MSRAGTGARDQVARLLTLLPLLHARGDLDIAEAAHVLGTSSKQVLKDLHVLWMCGLPGGYPDDLIDIDMDALTTDDGDGRIRVWNADYLTRPVRLSPVEATALLVALRSLRETATGESLAMLDRALTKISTAVSDGSTSRSIAVTPSSDPGHMHLAPVQEALAAGRQLQLSYWVPARDERTDRRVEPLQLHVVDGVRYLEAYCHLAQDLRRFRLDRMLAATVLEDPVSDREHDTVTPLGERLFVPDRDDPVVTLHLAPRARWIATYYPVLDTREDGSGGLEVDLVATDRGWLVQLLLRLAPDLRAVDPQVNASVREEAQSALALYPEDVLSDAAPSSPAQA